MDRLDREQLSELVAEREDAAANGNPKRRAYMQGRIDEYCAQNAISGDSELLDLRVEDGMYDA